MNTTYTGSWRLSQDHTLIRKAADEALEKVAKACGLEYASELHIWKAGARFTPYFDCENSVQTGGSLRVTGPSKLDAGSGMVMLRSEDDFDVLLDNRATTGIIVSELMARLPKFVEHVQKQIEERHS